MSGNNSGIFYFIELTVRWKKTLFAVLVISLSGSVITAFLLPVYYKSVSTFYPYSPKAYDPRYFFASSGNIELFGTGDDADRVVSIGNSSELANYIIEKYNLIDRYDIDRNNPYYYINVTKKFRKNYSIKEDMRSAIIVTVYDQNPDTAALIANDIVNYIDSLNRKPVIEANRDLLIKYKKDLELRYRTMDSIVKKSSKNSPGGQNGLNQIMSTDIMRTYNNLKEVETRMAVLNENFKTLYVIDRAAPVIKKAKPVRWLIVTLSTSGALLLTFICIVLIDQYNQVYKRSDKHFFKA
ncbi:MAG: hypothetical protein NZ529_09520 [Cytophagaceae bacterium]|nr:hypothetical protein [Cytophagaceae bacterium]MDW8457024.1 hypothetical protein [Cytophagaceae bacterium]